MIHRQTSAAFFAAVFLAAIGISNILGKADMGRPGHARLVDEKGVHLIFEPMIAEIKLDTNDWVGSVDEVSGLPKQ